MYYSRWSVVLVVAGISGGLFFTLLSGLLWARGSLVLGIDLFHYGFPFAWLSASRGVVMPLPPSPWRWHYSLIVQGFIADFIIYGLLTSVAAYFYLITITASKKKGKATQSSLS